MKLFDKISKKMAKTASAAVKEEVKSTAIDLLPTVIGIGGMILGFIIFRDHSSAESSTSIEPKRIEPPKPTYSQINITTNNYYFGNDARKMLFNNDDEIDETEGDC